jgi:mono/diheme cytochrome c family protein
MRRIHRPGSRLRIPGSAAIALCSLGLGSCHTDWLHSLASEVVQPPSPIATIPIEGFERDGASIAIGRVHGRTLAFVADDDEDAVHTIDLDQRVEIARTELAGRPSTTLILPNGELAVALRDAASVVVLAMVAPNQPLMMHASIGTADEPIALSASPDARMLWVASGVSSKLQGFTAATYLERATIALKREPRALTISADGARALVGYLSESGVTAVDLGTRGAVFATLGTTDRLIMGKSSGELLPARLARQTFALVRMRDANDTVLAPMQLVAPGEPLVITSGYGGSSIEAPVTFDLAKLDARTGIGPVMASTRGSEFDCRLPRGAALDASGHIAVACLGSNFLSVYNTHTEKPAHDEAYRIHIDGGPSAVAYDPMHNTFVAFAPFSRRLHVVTEKKSIPIALSHEDGMGLSSDAAEGRRLFHAANDTRISGDGRACASCHPDGRDDGLTWPTPKGPRQTVLLAGRLARPAPFGWDGKHESLAAHIKVTMTNLQGTGLPNAAISKLAAYLVQLPAPPKPNHDLGPEELKGQALFASQKTGCAGCHSDNAAYDVASATKVDTNKAFLAPSLRFIGASAPYFHDGRYPTLASMLHAKDNAMGGAGDLGDEDLHALEAYLRTL